MASHFPYFFFHVFSLSVMYTWLRELKYPVRFFHCFLSFSTALLCPQMTKYEECRKERTQYQSRVNETLLVGLMVSEIMPNVGWGKLKEDYESLKQP